MTSSQFLKNCSSEKTTRSAQAAPWLFSTLRDNTDQSLSAVRYHFKGKHPDQKGDRKSTRLNSSHGYISYAVFCLKKKKEHRRSERGVALRRPVFDAHHAGPGAAIPARSDGLRQGVPQRRRGLELHQRLIHPHCLA